MTSIVAATAGKSLATTAAKRFGTAVIERWTRYRAEQFFASFVEACGADLTSEAGVKESEVLLDEILTDEKKTEALFDAYRRICFSKSRDLGPRVVGLLTGKLIHENRMADGEEEAVFAAAELLSDGEFVEFMKEYHKHSIKAQGIEDQKAKHYMVGNSVHVRWCEEKEGMFGNGDFDIGPFPWEEAFGRWAVDLNYCGLMSARIQQRIEHRRPNYEDDRSISASVVTTISFSRGCMLLYELLARGLRGKGPE